MGQKRVQNIIDEKIGIHLSEFQRKVTDSLERSHFQGIRILNDRLERMEVRTDGFIKALDTALEYTKENRDFVEKYEMKMQLNYMLAGALGGGIGAVVVMLLLLWTGVI